MLIVPAAYFEMCALCGTHGFIYFSDKSYVDIISKSGGLEEIKHAHELAKLTIEDSLLPYF